MIKIPCSILEQVRKAPAAHAQILAATDKPISQGSYGMFACWKDCAIKVHTGELNISQSIKELQNKFLRFDDNVKNLTKQTRLLDQFTKYIGQYEKNGFEFVDSKRQIKWDIIQGVRLTGHTPWVVHSKHGYFAYFLTEVPIDWKVQLRFPLLQRYLTDHTIDCDITEMSVGTYCLQTNEFDFTSYKSKEIEFWVSETGAIFQTVLTEYQKLKKF